MAGADDDPRAAIRRLDHDSRRNGDQQEQGQRRETRGDASSDPIEAPSKHDAKLSAAEPGPNPSPNPSPIDIQNVARKRPSPG